MHVHSLGDQQATSYPLGENVFAGWVSWSRDGSEIIFNEFRQARPTEGTTLFGLDPATGTIRELFPRMKAINRLRVSPDGTKMVFYRGGVSQLVVADLGDPEGVVLVNSADVDNGGLATWVRPQLSPDGSTVLYGTQGDDWGEDDTCQLWLIAADGSNQRRIVSARWIPTAVWHPSGTHIVYNTWEEDEMGPSRLYVVNVESGEQDEIALPSGLDGMMIHQWSPDGKWIGAVAGSGNYEYWVVENPLGTRGGER